MTFVLCIVMFQINTNSRQPVHLHKLRILLIACKCAYCTWKALQAMNQDNLLLSVSVSVTAANLCLWFTIGICNDSAGQWAGLKEKEMRCHLTPKPNHTQNYGAELRFLIWEPCTLYTLFLLKPLPGDFLPINKHKASLNKCICCISLYVITFTTKT